MADRYAAFAELVQERLALENSVAESNQRGDSWFSSSEEQEPVASRRRWQAAVEAQAILARQDHAAAERSVISMLNQMTRLARSAAWWHAHAAASDCGNRRTHACGNDDRRESVALPLSGRGTRTGLPIRPSAASSANCLTFRTKNCRLWGSECDMQRKNGWPTGMTGTPCANRTPQEQVSPSRIVPILQGVPPMRPSRITAASLLAATVLLPASMTTSAALAAAVGPGRLAEPDISHISCGASDVWLQLLGSAGESCYTGNGSQVVNSGWRLPRSGPSAPTGCHLSISGGAMRCVLPVRGQSSSGRPLA